MFFPLGGSNLDLWVTTLAGLNRPEFYLTDRDVAPPADPKYQDQVQQWIDRGCTAWVTCKRELENYIHPTVLAGIAPGYAGTGDPFEDVSALFAQAVHGAASGTIPWATLPDEKRQAKISAAKRRLNTECVDGMTPALLTQADPKNEVRTWLRAIGAVLRA